MRTAVSPGNVVVVGSINLDEAISVTALPRPGETVIASASRFSPGGKGANQAVAAARAGGVRTTLVGSLGTDGAARTLRAALAADGITADVEEHPGPSGRAIVLLSETGENSIAVVPGANAALTALPQTDAIKKAGAILMQLETAHILIEHVGRAKDPNTWLILNAAPAVAIEPHLWQWVDLLVVNEHEAATYTGFTNPSSAADDLLLRVSRVIITLGARGSMYRDRDGGHEFVHAQRIRAVDTTAAGDTYCGVLAAHLSRGITIREAMETASRAAALTALAPGAQVSIPHAVSVATSFID